MGNIHENNGLPDNRSTDISMLLEAVMLSCGFKKPKPEQ